MVHGASLRCVPIRPEQAPLRTLRQPAVSSTEVRKGNVISTEEAQNSNNSAKVYILTANLNSVKSNV
jgi:hypothetical protein